MPVLRTRSTPLVSLLMIVAVSVLAGCNSSDQEPIPEAGFQSPTTISQTRLAPSQSVGGAGTPIVLSSGANAYRPVGAPEIVMGTGNTVSTGRAPTAPQVTTTGSDVTLDFSNVDIRDVLKSVLGDLLKVSYTVDPGVQGTITLQTGKPIPRSSIIDVMSTTLQLSGVALVARNGIYVAVPIANA